MIVVDASALLEFLLQTSIGVRREERIFRDAAELRPLSRASPPFRTIRLAHGEPIMMSNVLSESKDLPTSQRRWHRRRMPHHVYVLRCADNSL